MPSRLPACLVAVVAWTVCGTVVPGAAEFPAPFNTGADVGVEPLAAAESARRFRLPPGFRAQVFAAEPWLLNPVACAWDGRGRLWVAECLTYADPATKFDLSLRDRVTVLADRDGDGVADERTVFTDQVQRLTSVEVGRGGAWLLSLPQLLFVPDRDGDAVADGPAEVVLDGFEPSPENYHNCANGLRWGPDGWLYGRCGASSPGRIGPPGTPADRRVPVAGGIWRYHPATRTFEALCHGTTNPWGHDWDEHGELFFVNTVTGHLFHMLAGGHYTRSITISPHRWMYEAIDTHADHLHWDTGKGLTDPRGEGFHDALGGGHAHQGAMIYLASQWPAAYRGRLLTLNFHGRRMNVERLEPLGCGFVARHEADVCQAGDPWFRGIDLTYGPDGAVYVVDWSDTGECHEHDGVHRESGRVFRIAHGEAEATTRPPLVPLGDRTLAELVGLHAATDEWFVRQARRELANRAAAGVDVADVREPLERVLHDAAAGSVRRLRALWTLHTLGFVDRGPLVALLADPDERLRVWGLRLLADRWPLDTVEGVPRAEPGSVPAADVARLTTLAREDRSGLVLATLASLLQRLPLADRPPVAAGLVSHAEHATDHDLPRMIWYGLSPLARGDAAALVPLAVDGRMPRVRGWIAQAIASDPVRCGVALDALLQRATGADVAVKADVLRGLAAGMAGRRRVDPPASWQAFHDGLAAGSPDDVRRLAANIGLVFGDGLALDAVRAVALNDRAPMADRRTALETLIEARVPDLRETCERLLRVRFLNMTALRGLTLFDDPAIGAGIARRYTSFHPVERGAVIDALAARPAFARALLDEMAADKIPRDALSVFQARQILAFGDESLAARLAEVWGELRESPEEKRELITGLRRELAGPGAGGDMRRGRGVFDAQCASCHRLYGAGGGLGPDLTGSGRHNLDYLLENIVDPSAVVGKDFTVSVVTLADGRVLNGVVVGQDDDRVVLQTVGDRLTLLREDIEEISPTRLSPMPEGILQRLEPGQIRDLFAYLMGSVQVDPPDAVP